MNCESTCGCNNLRCGETGKGIGWTGDPSTRCKNRHTGCSCKPGFCFDNQCECYRDQRACNPDICTSCGCAWLPENSPLPVLRRCPNFDLVRGRHNKLFIGRSMIHGYGLFAGQNFRTGDLLGPYCGRVMDSDLVCLLYTSPSPRDQRGSRMPSSA